MKFPEHCLSMEAGLPSPVHKWLTEELEQLGIDSLIYTRYIISLLLHQDIEDLDWYDNDDVFCNKAKFDKSKKKGRKQDQKSSISEEEAKKTAVIDCLSAVSEEETGIKIKSLVEELCTKLKEKETVTEASNSQTTNTTSESSEESGTENQNPAERYYAAFPSLNSQESVPTPSQSPSVNVWKKNPLTSVKSPASTSPSATVTPGCDSSSPSEDVEVRKINISCKIAVPRHRKQKKNPNRNNNRGNQDKKKNTQRQVSTKPQSSNQAAGRGTVEKDGSIQSWPPGFAKTDPYVLQNIDMYGNRLVLRSDIKRPQDEICTQVETILKGYLMPAPDKTYKELQDVDTDSQFEQRERVKKTSHKDEANELQQTSSSATSLATDNHTDLVQAGSDDVDVRSNLSRQSSFSKQSCRDSVSPEFQEQEIWYTQPIDIVFLDQDKETQDSKLRLYKRNSLPLSSPGIGNLGDGHYQDCFLSSSSSSVCEQRDSRTSPDSDFILQGSDLIPSWLNEELLADFDDEESGKGDGFCDFKASSPNPGKGKSGSEIFNSFDIVYHQSESKDNPVEKQTWKRSSSNTPTSNVMQVSLIDLDYLSTMWQEYDDGLLPDRYPTNSRRHSLSSWQSRVLLDSVAFSDEFSESACISSERPSWQQWEFGGHCMAQLWDVNMQKRSKVSLWDHQIITTDNQPWCSENLFVFTDKMVDLQEDLTGMILSENENTLIPQISVVMVDNQQNDYESVLDDGLDDSSDDTNLICLPNMDRSVSLGDVYGWLDNSQKYTDQQLSKSFDLVASEHSAFYDVPRKLVHVHSEPNLVQFRQDFLDESKPKASSPQEHLFFSPKTHFRPITPAYAPELSSSTTRSQYVLNDLFGGLPATKTPYQQFHMHEGDSEEEAFIPKFKLKNFSKSIQTGESFENVESSEEEEDLAGEAEMRDTPETLTLGMIEDVMGEKDDDFLVPISEDFDTANTDSAYETDYGVSNSEHGQDGLQDGCQDCNKKCCQENMSEVPTGENETEKLDVGHVMNYTVKRFQATYPHTQDWPDMSYSLNCPTDSGQYWNYDWHSHSFHGCPMKSTWSTDDFMSSVDVDDKVEDKEVLSTDPGDHCDERDLYENWVRDTYTVPYEEQITIPGPWTEDYEQNLYFDGNCEAIYPVSWSSFDKEDEVTNDGDSNFNLRLHSFHIDHNSDEETNLVDNLFNPNLSLSDSQLLEGRIPEDAKLDDEQTGSCQRLKVFSSQFFIGDCSDDKMKQELSSVESDKNIETGVLINKPLDCENGQSSVFFQKSENNEGNHGVPPMDDDFYRVKLVYKDTTHVPVNFSRKYEVSKGCGIVPLPEAAKLSAELEKEWLSPDFERSEGYIIPSSSQRKPCSFFLEGNCRRTDCKFAHDIANITCRFWEEGGCFKGPLCPFLHGYPSVLPSSEKACKKFDLQGEEFPELTATVVSSSCTKKEKTGANGNSFKERVTRTPNRQTGPGSKKEKHRKQNNRRYSNKENRIELCIVDKCSSSI